MRALLVDDTAADLELLEAAFAAKGVVVTTAANDVAAYRILEDQAETFDLLVTDINLGFGTTGFDVAREARTRSPGIDVIYISAYDVSAQGHSVAPSLMLRKPMRLSELAPEILAYCNRSKREGSASSPMHHAG